MSLNPSCNRSHLGEDKRRGFPNLGDPPFSSECKDIAVAELTALGIPIIILTEKEIEVYKEGSVPWQQARAGMHGFCEVKPEDVETVTVYKMEGKAGSFTFYRAWYYWVCSGNVPLNVAEELYADPAGRNDVRAGGHCGALPPATQVHALGPNGKPAILPSQLEEFEATPEIITLLREKMDVVESMEGLNAAVETYHIDTPDGLKLYVDTLRKHGLIP